METAVASTTFSSALWPHWAVFFCAVLSVVDDDVPFWLARNIYKQLIETLVDRIFFHLRKALYGLEVP